MCIRDRRRFVRLLSAASKKCFCFAFFNLLLYLSCFVIILFYFAFIFLSIFPLTFLLDEQETVCSRVWWDVNREGPMPREAVPIAAGHPRRDGHEAVLLVHAETLRRRRDAHR